MRPWMARADLEENLQLMTVLASRSAYDDYDEDYRSHLDSKYEEGFGHGPELDYDNEDDDLFAGLFDDAADEDEDDAEPSPAREAALGKKSPGKKSPGKKSPSAKAPSAKSPSAESSSAKSPSAKSPSAKSPSAKSTTTTSQGAPSSPVVVRPAVLALEPQVPVKAKEATAMAPRVGTSRVSASGVVVTLASPTRLIVTKADPASLPAQASPDETSSAAPTVEAHAVIAEPEAPEHAEAPVQDPALVALAEAASRARVAAEAAANAAKRAVTEAVAKAATAKAAVAEASAAEDAAQAALARSTAAEEEARAAMMRHADAQRAAAERGEELMETAALTVGTHETAGTGETAEASGEPTRAAAHVPTRAAAHVPTRAAAHVPTRAAAHVPTRAAAHEPAPALASVDVQASDAVVREPAPVTDPLFAPAIALVNEHVDFLRKLRPGFDVPYVDPMHSAEECRILSLFSNTGEANPRGFVWAGDDDAATRLLGLQFQLGLRPEWIMPWNVNPWFTPGEANGKLTPEQVQGGLKPLLALLKLLPRTSAIVAHGPEANRLAQMLLKTDNPLIWRRGLKVYKARSLHGRAFAGSKERQTEWLIEMGKSYADAMARAGVQLRRA